eukprot:gene21377-28320_t
MDRSSAEQPRPRHEGRYVPHWLPRVCYSHVMKGGMCPVCATAHVMKGDVPHLVSPCVAQPRLKGGMWPTVAPCVLQPVMKGEVQGQSPVANRQGPTPIARGQSPEAHANRQWPIARELRQSPVANPQHVQGSECLDRGM